MGADRFTLELVAASLQAAADEMFAVLRKTAMSAIIYEVLDAGTAVTDGDGNLASSGAGIPSFVGVLDKAVKRILELHGGGRGRATSSSPTIPFYGGVTHLNDVVLAMPVFAEGQLVAWTASDRALERRRRDGARARSRRTRREIFQEGLRLPAVKLFDRGRELALGDADHGGEQPPAGVPARRPLGRASPPSASARSRIARARRALRRRARSSRRSRACTTTARQVALRRWRRCRTGVSSSRRSRTAAPSTTSRSSSRRTGWSSTCATTRTRMRARRTSRATAR